MIVETTKFGRLEVRDEETILFEEGIPGFPGRKRFVILEGSSEGPFRWFQCVEDGSLAFIVMDPVLVAPNYLTAIPKDYLEKLDLQEPRQAVVLVIVRIHREKRSVTANLLAPLIINPRNRRGKQVILMESGYEIGHEVMPLPEETPSRAQWDHS